MLAEPMLGHPSDIELGPVSTTPSPDSNANATATAPSPNSPDASAGAGSDAGSRLHLVPGLCTGAALCLSIAALGCLLLAAAAVALAVYGSESRPRPNGYEALLAGGIVLLVLLCAGCGYVFLPAACEGVRPSEAPPMHGPLRGDTGSMVRAIFFSFFFLAMCFCIIFF